MDVTDSWTWKLHFVRRDVELVLLLQLFGAYTSTSDIYVFREVLLYYVSTWPLKWPWVFAVSPYNSFDTDFTFPHSLHSIHNYLFYFSFLGRSISLSLLQSLTLYLTSGAYMMYTFIKDLTTNIHICVNTYHITIFVFLDLGYLTHKYVFLCSAIYLSTSWFYFIFNCQ